MVSWSIIHLCSNLCRSVVLHVVEERWAAGWWRWGLVSLKRDAKWYSFIAITKWYLVRSPGNDSWVGPWVIVVWRVGVGGGNSWDDWDLGLGGGEDGEGNSQKGEPEIEIFP